MLEFHLGLFWSWISLDRLDISVSSRLQEHSWCSGAVGIHGRVISPSKPVEDGSNEAICVFLLVVLSGLNFVILLKPVLIVA